MYPKANVSCYMLAECNRNGSPYEFQYCTKDDWYCNNMGNHKDLICDYDYVIGPNLLDTIIGNNKLEVRKIKRSPEFYNDIVNSQYSDHSYDSFSSSSNEFQYQLISIDGKLLIHDLRFNKYEEILEAIRMNSNLPNSIYFIRLTNQMGENNIVKFIKTN